MNQVEPYGPIPENHIKIEKKDVNNDSHIEDEQHTEHVQHLDELISNDS